jgi:hypothetical protein
LIHRRISSIFPCWFDKVNLEELLAPLRDGDDFPPLDEDCCLVCGHRLSRYGTRDNEIEPRQKKYCPECGKHATIAFNHGSRVPEWVYRHVLLLSALNYRDRDIIRDIELKSMEDKLKPRTINVPTIYRIRASVNAILEEAEPIILRYLSKEPQLIKGTWLMDVRSNYLPFRRVSPLGRRLDKSNGHPKMHESAVKIKAPDYCLSGEVSMDQTQFSALSALILGLDRTGARPAPLLVDAASGLDKAVMSLLTPDEVKIVNKSDPYYWKDPIMNDVERWFSHYGQRDDKRHCQHRRLWTQQSSLNIYRWYRNYIWPRNLRPLNGLPRPGSGKTPAEFLGLALPAEINNDLDFLPLVKFSYRLTQYVKSEIARAHAQKLWRHIGIFSP